MIFIIDAIDPIAEVYRRKSRGPSTEPRGPPHMTGVEGEVNRLEGIQRDMM